MRARCTESSDTISVFLIPLAANIFWGPMAITIMGGPFVATLLTVLAVPAFYALWLRVRDQKGAPAMPANGESEAFRGRFAPVRSQPNDAPRCLRRPGLKRD
jgi:hypothetical protein